MDTSSSRDQEWARAALATLLQRALRAIAADFERLARSVQISGRS
jgi:hypothetical protein